MKHYFQAEQLKYRHTSVAAITIGMPMFTALLAFWLTSSYFSVDVYNWWYIGLYPGFLGILCSIIGKKDKQKKNYTIWSLPCGMEQIWDAKILVGIKMSAVAVAGLTLFSMMGQMLLESVGNLKMRQAIPIQAQILDLMNQLKKETGTSILFITHDLGVVAEVCDDVAVMYCGRVVERGDVKTIFANPSHPYTKGLLGSIPRLGDAGKELKSIPGNVPNPKYMPKGCKFEPRCPYASEKCREEEPGFFQIEEGHISRCWLCESGQLKTDHVEKAGD